MRTLLSCMKNIQSGMHESLKSLYTTLPEEEKKDNASAMQISTFSQMFHSLQPFLTNENIVYLYSKFKQTKKFLRFCSFALQIQKRVW